MFKINEKTLPRLSKTVEGCIIVSAFKKYREYAGHGADIGMFKDSKSFMFVCLDRVGGIIDGTEKTFQYSDFEQVYINGVWKWQTKEQE